MAMECDSDFEMALQSIQRDINCLTHDERGVRKEAIVKLREALLASARINVDPVRRFRVPKNPVALRAEADFKSEARAFMLQCGDTIEALETCMVQGRERVHFKWQDLDCWASLKAGDGGILLEELPGAKPGVVGTVTAQPGLLAFLLKAVHIPMIRCLMDSVEKCRELTADALVEIIAIADDVNQIFEVCVPVLTERVGLKQIEESAEEIRLRLVTLLTAFVASHKLNPELLASKLDAMCTVLKKMSADPFPEIKKACADCAISLVAEDPVNMRHHTPSIAKAILLNTGHQHSKVRNISVSALGALVSNGAEAAFEDLAPQLLVLSRDHSSSVRETVATITGGWLSLYIGDRELCPHLLRLLLAGMADEAAAVSAVAVKGIIDASKLYREARVEEGKWPDVESGGTTGDDIALAPRVMIREYLPGILPVLIKELSDWTSKTRIHAAGALTVLLEYSGDAVTSHLDSLLPSLYHAIGDDEIAIVKMITRCVEKLGVTVSIDSWLPLVLEDALKQSVGGSVVTLKFSVLCLTALLRGLRLSPECMTMKPQLTNITAFLSNPVLCCNPTLEVTYAVFQATSEVVESIEIFECDEEDERRIFIALLHAAAMTSHSEMQEEAVNEIARLAKVLKLESVEALYKRHFSNVLSLLVADGSYRNWSSDSPGRSLFDVLGPGRLGAVKHH
jgi:dynein assembly factor 5